MSKRKLKKKRNSKRIKPLQKVALQGNLSKTAESKRQNVAHQRMKTKKVMMIQMKKMVLKAAWTLLLKEIVTLLPKPDFDQITKIN